MKKNNTEEGLLLLTTIFSIIYFGFMKWIISQPFTGMSVFLITTSTVLILSWLVVSYKSLIK